MVLSSRKVLIRVKFLSVQNELIKVAKGFYTSNGNKSFTFYERRDGRGLFDDVVLKKPQRNVPENITQALAKPAALHCVSIDYRRCSEQ